MDVTHLAFLEMSRRLLTRHYLPKIRLSVEAMSDDDVWWRPDETVNAAGNLLLHLAGNARQWIVSGVGGAPDARDRAREFAERARLPRAELLARLSAVVDDVDATIARVTPEQLGDRRSIQGRDVTVFEAIYHVIEHFSMHTGQIILLAKLRAPGAIRFYDDTGGSAKPLWPEAQPDLGR